MPTKIKGVNLADHQPTPEELAEAKSEVGPPGSMKRKKQMASFAHWVRDSPQSEDIGRGAVREKYLTIYMAHVKREKANLAKATVNKEYEKKSEKTVQVFWWSREKMDMEMGPLKAAHWRDGNFLATQGDKFSGSKKADFIEYGVPVEWKKMTEAEIKGLKSRIEKELEDNDMDIVKELCGGISGGGTAAGEGGGTASAEVKEEPSELQKLQQRIDNLYADPSPVYHKFQDMYLNNKVTMKKIEDATPKERAMAVCLASDLGKHVSKLGKLVKLLEHLCIERPNKESVHELIVAMDQANAKEVEIKDCFVV